MDIPREKIFAALVRRVLWRRLEMRESKPEASGGQAAGWARGRRRAAAGGRSPSQIRKGGLARLGSQRHATSTMRHRGTCLDGSRQPRHGLACPPIPSIPTSEDQRHTTLIDITSFKQLFEELAFGLCQTFLVVQPFYRAARWTSPSAPPSDGC